MTTTTHDADERLNDAATLAFAMLRFEMAAAHRANEVKASVGGVRFLPCWREVQPSLIIPYLASCPSPAILAPTTWPGTVSLMLVSELSDDRREWAEYSFRNWTQHLAECAEKL